MSANIAELLKQTNDEYGRFTPEQMAVIEAELNKAGQDADIKPVGVDFTDSYDSLTLHLTRLKALVVLVRDRLEMPNDSEVVQHCITQLYMAEEEIEAVAVAAEELYRSGE